MKFKKPLLGTALAFQAFLAGNTAWGATFNVNTSQELRDALAQAAGNRQDDLILIGEGTFLAGGTPFSYNADNILNDSEDFDLTLQGAGVENSILDAEGLGPVLTIASSFKFDDNDTTIRVSGLTFQNGDAADTGSGGGLTVSANEADIVVEQAHFLNCDAGLSFGGGAQLYTAQGEIRLDRSFFSGNAGEGGAGASLLSALGKIVVANSIFASNASKNHGGGLLVGQEDDSGLEINVVNNTFFGNSAVENGGGLYLTASDDQVSNVYNNLFSVNVAGAGRDLFYFESNATGPAFTLGLYHNVLADIADNCQNGALCQPRIMQAANMASGPFLLDPANGNFALADDSPAIDAGSASAPDLPAFDFAGNARSRGSAPDIGALESEPEPPAAEVPSNSGGCSLGMGKSWGGGPFLGGPFIAGLYTVLRRRKR